VAELHRHRQGFLARPPSGLPDCRNRLPSTSAPVARSSACRPVGWSCGWSYSCGGSAGLARFGLTTGAMTSFPPAAAPT